MGECLKSKYGIFFEECFPETLNTDDCYVFAEGKINGTSTNNLDLKGCKSVSVCFADETEHSYKINIEENSQIKLYTCFAENSQSKITITNCKNSVCEHISMQLRTSFLKIEINQQVDSIYKAGYFQFTGKKDGIDLLVNKDAEGANTTLYGVFFPSNGEEYSITTRVNHNKPSCETDELFRGIGDGNGFGEFAGLVYVAKDSQKTVAHQQNRNILLSNKARIQSKPQLEIYADDVICNHGSSTGKIDSEALWYMQARGIDKITAERLLVSGFANDVIAKLSSVDLQEFIAKKISTKLNRE